MARDRRSGTGTSLGMMGVVGLAVLCCAGPVLLATVGVGTLAAAFTTWWLLVPAGLAAAGVVAWYSWRRSCRIRDQQTANQDPTDTREERVRR